MKLTTTDLEKAGISTYILIGANLKCLNSIVQVHTVDFSLVSRYIGDHFLEAPH